MALVSIRRLACVRNPGKDANRGNSKLVDEIFLKRDLFEISTFKLSESEVLTKLEREVEAEVNRLSIAKHLKSNFIQRLD